MRAVIQRVSSAEVKVAQRLTGRIGKGVLVFLGITEDDVEKDIDYLIEKIIGLRIFEDENGKMNISLKDINGEMLIVSQFTLYGDCRRGKRPSYDNAARPEKAETVYKNFIERCRENGLKVEKGEFRAHMDVEIHNDGPVTLLLDSRKLF